MLTSRQAPPPALLDTGLMAIIRTASSDEAERSAHQLARLGVRVLEISLVVPGALDAIRRVRESLPVDVLVGAGTVLNAEDARAALDSGSQFLVAPGFDSGVASVALSADVGFYPGAATPTEIVTAWDAGATAVKLFPAGALGARYLRAIREPLPSIPLLAVGGVSASDAAEFFAVGAIGVGLGSALQADDASVSATLAAIAAAKFAR